MKKAAVASKKTKKEETKGGVKASKLKASKQKISATLIAKTKGIKLRPQNLSSSLKELIAFALGVVFMGCFSYVMVHYRMDRDFRRTQKRLSYLHFVIQKGIDQEVYQHREDLYEQ